MAKRYDKPTIRWRAKKCIDFEIELETSETATNRFLMPCNAGKTQMNVNKREATAAPTTSVVTFTSPPGGTIDPNGPYAAVNLAAGQFISGGTNGIPQPTTLVAGSGIQLTPATNTLTIAAPGTTGTPNTVAVFNNAGSLTGTTLLPTQVLTGNASSIPTPTGNLILDAVNANTAVGPSAAIGNGNTNATAIGAGATTTANNQIVLGNSNVTQIIPTSATATLGTTTNPFASLWLSPNIQEFSVSASLNATQLTNMQFGGTPGPVLIVPAVTGKLIRVTDAIVNFIYGGTAVTNATAVTLNYGNSVSATALSNSYNANIFTQGHDTWAAAGGIIGSGLALAVGDSGQGLYFTSFSTQMAGGTGSILNVFVKYTMIPIS